MYHGFMRMRTRNFVDLLDGDIYTFTPGEEITNIPTFRVLVHRMAAENGLKYRTNILEDGDLEVEMYRDKPGDLFEETYDQDGLPRRP